MHLWPYISKCKMCLGGDSFFFNFRKFVYIFSCLFTILQKNCLPLSLKHFLFFGFTKMGSQVLDFRAVAIWNQKFWFGSPCRNIMWRIRFLFELLYLLRITLFRKRVDPFGSGTHLWSFAELISSSLGLPFFSNPMFLTKACVYFLFFLHPRHMNLKTPDCNVLW